MVDEAAPMEETVEELLIALRDTSKTLVQAIEESKRAKMQEEAALKRIADLQQRFDAAVHRLKANFPVDWGKKAEDLLEPNSLYQRERQRLQTES